MKATLEFILPEEIDEHKRALNGSLYYWVIKATLEKIREKIKYEELTHDKIELLEEIRDFINEEMSEE